MSKRKPEDVLKDIEGSDLDDAVEQVAAMTAEQRRDALKAAGVDVAEVHAKADALYERLQRAEPARAKRSPARIVVPIAAVAAVAALAAAVIPQLSQNVASPESTPPDAGTDGADATPRG